MSLRREQGPVAHTSLQHRDGGWGFPVHPNEDGQSGGWELCWEVRELQSGSTVGLGSQQELLPSASSSMQGFKTHQFLGSHLIISLFN